MKIEQLSLTFDDVLLVPKYSEITPKDANTKSILTKNIHLNIPLMSAAMDTVSEATLAIAIAQEGGIGIIHKNMPIEQQAQEVIKVKRFEAGVIKDPIVADTKASIKDICKLQKKHNISALPIIDASNKVVGIITARDVRYQQNLDVIVTEVMTKKLITVKPNTPMQDVRKLLQKHRIERVLVIENNHKLAGMITVSDIQKSTNFPNASKDNDERLIVGAAVGVINIDTISRIDALVAAGVDIITIDTAHGHSKGVIDTVKMCKEKYPKLEIIAGNIATGEAAIALVKAGADAVKVGIGPGSICTTRIISGVGVPQISAIYNVAKALKNKNIGIIADGGIRYSGDIAKAIAAGATTVMLGSVFAGTTESPGEVELYQGRSYKSYRGMGSIGAMNQRHGSADRYFQATISTNKLVPEGIEGRVDFKGSIRPIIHQMIGGLRSAMGYIGCKDINEMHKNTVFTRITNAGMNESHVHDVLITKEAPNYHK